MTATDVAGPPKATPEVKEKVMKIVTGNSTTRGYSTEEIAEEYYEGTKEPKATKSKPAVYRILKRNGANSVELTIKPRLNKEQQWRRFEWVLEAWNWSDDFLHTIVWSDETSLVLGSNRGKRRMWKNPNEAYNAHCVRNRWKRRMECMFWGCFSYYKVGPGYCWPVGTKAMTEIYAKLMASYNSVVESSARID